MRRGRKVVFAVCIVASVLVCVGGWAVFQSEAQAPERSFAHFMPQGAVLFLEGKNFGGMLQEWGASPQKQEWLKSDNYEVFSRSRLFLRLQQVQGEFAAAAGVPPDMNFLSQVAGERSALAIYDIGKVELLYISRLPSARFTQSALWQKRAQFEPRQAAGQQFFVHTDPESGRAVAFAVVNDMVLLATREDLMAGALALLAGQKLATVAEEKWFADAVSAAKEPGELRMVVNLAVVTHTPQFRTYWVQRNITELRGYEAALTDLYREGPQYREERILLRASGQQVQAGVSDSERSAADLLQIVPPEAGVYRIAASPTPQSVVAALQQKILTPRLGVAPPSKLAPVVAVSGGTVGNETDLETRIDTPPPADATDSDAGVMLKALIEKADVRAMLEIGRSEPSADGVFVLLRSTVVLTAATEWDTSAVHGAMQRVLAPSLTTANMGSGWRQAGDVGARYYRLDGLGGIAVAVKGRSLVVSNDEPMLAAVLKSSTKGGQAEPIVYAAGFNHARERESFYKFASVVAVPNRTTIGDNEPDFFSKNIASLSHTLAGVQSESVVVRRAPDMDMQTVHYQWAR